jgi:hypothetical protein
MVISAATVKSVSPALARDEAIVKPTFCAEPEAGRSCMDEVEAVRFISVNVPADTPALTNTTELQKRSFLP